MQSSEDILQNSLSNEPQLTKSHILVPLPSSKLSSTGLNQLTMSGQLRRAQMTQPTSIPSNSVEYLQFQELALQPRASPGKKTTPMHDPHPVVSISHPPNQLPTHTNLITASLSLNENFPLPAASEIENIEPSPGDSQDSTNPIRISKKDLKRLPKSEVTQRKLSQSQHASITAPMVQDSLDNGRNPWCN